MHTHIYTCIHAHKHICVHTQSINFSNSVPPCAEKSKNGAFQDTGFSLVLMCCPTSPFIADKGSLSLLLSFRPHPIKLLVQQLKTAPAAISPVNN